MGSCVVCMDNERDSSGEPCGTKGCDGMRRVCSDCRVRICRCVFCGRSIPFSGDVPAQAFYARDLAVMVGALNFAAALLRATGAW